MGISQIWEAKSIIFNKINLGLQEAYTDDFKKIIRITPRCHYLELSQNLRLMCLYDVNKSRKVCWYIWPTDKWGTDIESNLKNFRLNLIKTENFYDNRLIYDPLKAKQLVPV